MIKGTYEIRNLLEQEESEEQEEEPEEFEPLKKFQLIQKLRDLNNRLKEKSIVLDDLDTILKFSNELSYDTLVQLSDGIIKYIETQFKESMKNDNK